MELDELKDLWKEENKKLESRIQLNEQLLKKMNIEKSVGEFDKQLKFAAFSRYLMVTEFLFSIWMAPWCLMI